MSPHERAAFHSRSQCLAHIESRVLSLEMENIYSFKNSTFKTAGKIRAFCYCMLHNKIE